MQPVRAGEPKEGSVPDSGHEQDTATSRAEIDALISERRALLRTAGAAAVFVAKLDSHPLPESAYHTADPLASALNDLSAETLRDAIELIRRQAREDA
jgi:hypothetical protein